MTSMADEQQGLAPMRSDPHQVIAERVTHLYRHAGLGLLINAGNGLIAAAAAYQYRPWPWVLGWVVFLLLANGMQYWYGTRNASAGRVVSGSSQIWPHLLMTALVGLVWGAGAVVLLDPSQAVAKLLLVLLLCIAVVGVLPMYIAMPSVLATYLWCAFLPWLALLLLSKAPGDNLIAGVIALFALNVLITGRAMYAALTENLRRQSGFQHLANVDGLTGVPNRRFFDQALVNEWNRASRSGAPLSLILIDVDHFKKYNDFYGHPEGDDCLRRVAEALAGRVRRAGDVLARYGGEEFVLLLYHVAKDDGMALAEQLRRSIEQLNLAHEPSAFGRVTISLGGATLIPGEQGTASGLVDAADQALYRAKAHGRNRVEWSALV